MKKSDAMAFKITITPKNGAFEGLAVIVDRSEWIRTNGQTGECTNNRKTLPKLIRAEGLGVPNSSFEVELSWKTFSLKRKAKLVEDVHTTEITREQLLAKEAKEAKGE